MDHLDVSGGASTLYIGRRESSAASAHASTSLPGNLARHCKRRGDGKMDDFPAQLRARGRLTPDHARGDLPAAQLHEEGAAWREQTVADFARVSRRPRGLLAAAAILGIIG